MTLFYGSRRLAIGAANQATRETAQQHVAYYRSGWLIRNLVTNTVFDARGTVVVGTV